VSSTDVPGLSSSVVVEFDELLRAGKRIAAALLLREHARLDLQTIADVMAEREEFLELSRD
jgi:hypothetical protein